MQLAILCGGIGSRLAPISQGLPKGLIEIRGIPFMSYLIESLDMSNFSSIHFCIGYKADFYLRYFSDTLANILPIPFTYSIENEGNLLGTAGALLGAFHLLEDTFVVQYGDTILNLDYKDFFYKYNASKMQIGMSIIHCSRSDESPNVKRIDSDPCLGQQSSFIYCKNTPLLGAEYIDYGALCMSKQSLIANKDLGPDLSSYQAFLSLAGQCFFYQVDKPYLEIGTPQSYSRAAELL